MDPTSLDTDVIAAARLWAATRAPYLATALFACTVVPSPACRTMAADRAWRVYVDPDVAAGLTAPDLGRLLVHLVSHLLRDHADRASALFVDATTQPWWRRCTDAEINDDLRASDLLPPVANDLPTDLGGVDGQLAETYFAQAPVNDLTAGATLAAEAAQAAQTAQTAQTVGGAGTAGRVYPSDCGSAADGLERSWDDVIGEHHGLSAGEAERLRHEVADSLCRADLRDPGSVPGGWLRWAETVLRSHVDWRRVLAAEVRRAVAAVTGSVDYTYRRPARRSHSLAGDGPQVILPSLYRPRPEVAVVCDTSASMETDDLAQVLAEVDGILERAGLRAVGVTTLSTDTRVHAAGRVRRATEVSLLGGGGTDMSEGITAALARRPRPEIVVVLTDGHTPWPDVPPRGVRVVVGLVGSPHAPPAPPAWARTVLITR